VPTRHTIPEDFIAHPAGADLSLSQYRMVTRDGSGNIVRAGAGASVYGILENNPTVGRHANVCFREGAYFLVVSGAAFARDAKLTSDAQGRAVDAGGTAGTNYVLIAEEAATAADQIVSVRISRSQV
jgi:Uncharacterized conserved protein (DUF2190)